MTDGRPVVYVITCAAPRATRTPHLVGLLQAAGWDVCVIATPQALGFIDVDELEQLTGHPVRSTYKRPNEPDVLPPADAMVVCPATFNTMNKWALGIADTLALGQITEAVGTGVKLVAAPSLNNAQEQHPAFARSVETLRKCGVTVLYGPGVYEPTEPGTGGREYKWGLIVEALGTPQRQDEEPANNKQLEYARLRAEYRQRTLETIELDVMADARVWSVVSTFPSRDQALEVARTVVKERLAASAEVTGPATSAYWHLGELGESDEWKITLRTSSGARDVLAARIVELHPWDNPEVSATPVAWCADSYAAWIERTTNESDSED